jgi:hypothetical protein
MMMRISPAEVRERQKAMRDVAAGQREAHRLRTVGRAQRRSERAELALVQSWNDAARLRAELAEVHGDWWR